MLQGIQDKGFYDLINGALNLKGYSSIREFFEAAPRNWYDTENYKKTWAVEPYANPTRDFKQYIGEIEIPVMATYLADDAETPLISNQGFKVQTSSIPRMGLGYLFGAKAYDDARNAEALLQGEIFGRIFDAWRKDVYSLIKGIHSQRSFTAAQVESLGYYKTTRLNNNGGIENLQISFSVPTANKKKAGGYAVAGYSHGKKYVWSHDNASPIGDLKDMFHYAWVNNILSAVPANSVFRMSVAAYEVLKNHIDTKKRVLVWKTGGLMETSNYASVEVTDDDLANYLRGIGLPPIQKDEYYGFTEYIDANKELKRKELAAFDANTVVLRPAGNVGSFQWSRVSNIFASSIAPVYYADGGTIAVQEDVFSRENAKKFSATSLCVPVPYAVNKMLYLSINEAAD